jgi:hypothetical protein
MGFEPTTLGATDVPFFNNYAYLQDFWTVLALLEW